MKTTRSMAGLIALIAAACAVAITACGGDGDEARNTPSPVGRASLTVTAEAVSTPEVASTTVTEPTVVPETPALPSESGGMDGFRAFALQIEQAIADRDDQFFINSAKISTTTCPNEFEPRCDDQPVGTVVEGVWMGIWRSEGSLPALDSLSEDLAGYLGSLSDPTLYAIGDNSGHVSAFFGLENAFFAVVVSSDDPVSTTRVVTFEFSPEERGWQTAMVTKVGTSLTEEWISGDCTECYDHWERWGGAP